MQEKYPDFKQIHAPRVTCKSRSMQFQVTCKIKGSCQMLRALDFLHAISPIGLDETGQGRKEEMMPRRRFLFEIFQLLESLNQFLPVAFLALKRDTRDSTTNTACKAK